MKLVALLMIVTLGLTGCASVPAQPLVSPPVHSQGDATLKPLVELDMHGDTDFTEHDRTLISVAVKRLYIQTKGRFLIHITYDLDLHSEPPHFGEQWNLIQVPEKSNFAHKIDQEIGGIALGLTIRGAEAVFLITERLDSDMEFVHVTMHELLHAIGLHHTEDENSVMYPSANETSTITMKPADLKEFCRAVQMQGTSCN